MEFASIKCVSHWEASQSKLLVLTLPPTPIPLNWLGRERGKSQNKCKNKQPVSLYCGLPSPGQVPARWARICGKLWMMSRSWTGCQWQLRVVPVLMAYITAWQGDVARRKHAGFQQHIIISDFSVCSAVFNVVGEAAAQEEENSDTLQPSVSFCKTNSPKQIPVARKFTRATQGRSCTAARGSWVRRPETDLKSGAHHVPVSPGSLGVPDAACPVGSEGCGLPLWWCGSLCPVTCSSRKAGIQASYLGNLCLSLYAITSM